MGPIKLKWNQPEIKVSGCERDAQYLYINNEVIGSTLRMQKSYHFEIWGKWGSVEMIIKGYEN